MALQQTHPLPEERRGQAPIRLTPQEVMVFKDCMRESFYQRSLPLSTVLAGATYALCQKGFLKKHPKYGVLGKVGLAVGIGYIAGKIMYYQTCYERTLNVPGGALAAQLRERQGNKEMLDPGFMSPSTFDTSPPASRSVDEPHSSSLNLDLESVPVSEPEFTRLHADDFTFNESKLNEPLLYSPPITSYEELRKQNRDQYEAQRNLPNQSPPARPYKPPSSSILLEPEERVAYRKNKNQYGDDMEL